MRSRIPIWRLPPPWCSRPGRAAGRRRCKRRRTSQPEPPPETSDEAGESSVSGRRRGPHPRRRGGEPAARPPRPAACRRRPRTRSPGAGRAGAAASAQRGRPVGTRPGDPRRGRLALIETLRAAAPWQRLRRGEGEARLRITADDLRIRRLVQKRETTTIFAVDASGSAALERLAEAKGAVESLLAECYVRRDRVALVAFRGRGADLLLVPTRSLVRAKRALASLRAAAAPRSRPGSRRRAGSPPPSARQRPKPGRAAPHRRPGQYRPLRGPGPGAGRGGCPRGGPGPRRRGHAGARDRHRRPPAGFRPGRSPPRWRRATWRCRSPTPRA